MNLEKLIFNLYKDTYIVGKEFRIELIKKYKLKNTEISDIRAKITKYQIEKYGSILCFDKEFKNKEEMKNLSRISNKRKSARRNRDRKN